MGYISAALPEKAVHEGGLAVVHMRDYCHVSEPARVECACRGSGGCGGGGGGGEGTWEDVVGFGFGFGRRG